MFNSFSAFYIHHFLKPKFKKFGKNVMILNPQNLKIFGNNISISVFASKCNTITYEVSSKIGLRVKRIYN